MEPGSYLPIEQFPILALLPDFLIPSKARAKACYQTITQTWTRATSLVESRRQNNDTRDSLLDRMLSDEIKSDIPMTPIELSNFMGAIMQGAAETTSSVMLSNILYLAANPWVQKRAQEELDKVCGVERMPTWSDFSDLPYINCILKEGLRIRPAFVLPLPLPFPYPSISSSQLIRRMEQLIQLMEQATLRRPPPRNPG